MHVISKKVFGAKVGIADVVDIAEVSDADVNVIDFAEVAGENEAVVEVSDASVVDIIVEVAGDEKNEAIEVAGEDVINGELVGANVGISAVTDDNVVDVAEVSDGVKSIRSAADISAAMLIKSTPSTLSKNESSNSILLANTILTLFSVLQNSCKAIISISLSYSRKCVTIIRLNTVCLFQATWRLQFSLRRMLVCSSPSYTTTGTC